MWAKSSRRICLEWMTGNAWLVYGGMCSGRNALSKRSWKMCYTTNYIKVLSCRLEWGGFGLCAFPIRGTGKVNFPWPFSRFSWAYALIWPFKIKLHCSTDGIMWYIRKLNQAHTQKNCSKDLYSCQSDCVPGCLKGSKIIRFPLKKAFLVCWL